MIGCSTFVEAVATAAVPQLRPPAKAPCTAKPAIKKKTKKTNVTKATKKGGGKPAGKNTVVKAGTVAPPPVRPVATKPKPTENENTAQPQEDDAAKALRREAAGVESDFDKASCDFLVRLLKQTMDKKALAHFLANRLDSLDFTALYSLLRECLSTAELTTRVDPLRLVRNKLKHASPDKKTWLHPDFQANVEAALRTPLIDADLTHALKALLAMAAKMRNRENTASPST